MAGGAIVTPQWLSTLGVEPVLGRRFRADEGEPGRNGVVVLTQEYWRRRFDADPRVIGTTVHIDGAPATIIGVLPANVLRYGADILSRWWRRSIPRTPAIVISMSWRGCGQE